MTHLCWVILLWPFELKTELNWAQLAHHSAQLHSALPPATRPDFLEGNGLTEMEGWGGGDLLTVKWPVKTHYT